MNPISPELPLLAPTSIDDLRMQGHSTLRMPQKADTGIENLLLSDARAREAAMKAEAMKVAFAESRMNKKRGRAIAKAKDRLAQRIAEGR